MADADPLAARIAEDRERVKAAFRELYPLHPGDVATAAQVLASGIALGTADRLLAVVEAALALHDGKPYYLAASDCDHPEPPEGTGEWADWDGEHVPGTGDVGAVCLLTQTGSYCPECTRVTFGDEEPQGEDYISAPCDTRQAITKALLGEAPHG